MLDKTLIYALVQQLPDNVVKLYPVWPESFQAISEKLAIGYWKVADDSTATTTSTNKEYETRIRIEISFWCRTPEQQNEVNQIVDSIFNPVFSRLSYAEVPETLEGNIRASRSIVIYTGIVDNNNHVRRI